MRPLLDSSHKLTDALALALLCLGLGLTALSVKNENDRIQASAQVRFDNHAARLESAIKSRFANVLMGFRGMRAFMEASPSPVDRQAFSRWVAARDMNTEFPGVRGVGFIERVQRDELATFVARERADHAPTFSVRGSGVSPDLFVIKYIEPMVNNAPAWGYDVGSEYTRRAAATRAIASGEPALTASITLVQDGKQRPGFLYYQPIYHPTNGRRPATPAEREVALRGLVYSPIVLEELMGTAESAADKLLDFEVFDGLRLTPASLIYDHDARPACLPGNAGSVACEPRGFMTVKQLSIGGRMLTVAISGTPAFTALIDHSTPHWMAVGGVLLSVLLSALVWVLGSGRARSQTLAEHMTHDLQASKRQLEAALRDSDALLTALNQHAIVSTADRAGCILAVNDSFCRISGYNREELLGQNHRIVNSGTHPPEFWRAMWKTIHAGTPWRGTVCNRSKDGQLYWVDTFIAPFVDHEGKVDKYISIRTDITQAKADELALQEHSKRFELAIEGASDGLWDWVDVRRSEEWWSPQFYRLLGFEPGEITASVEGFNALLHPDQTKFVAHATAEALAGRNPIDLECALRTKSGEYRWFHARAKVYRDARGRAVRMAGSLQDIHEQRLAKEQLRAHSEQLSAIFTLSPDGFVSFAGQRTVALVSPTVTRLTGLLPSELLGLDEADFLARLQALCSPGTRISGLDSLTPPEDAGTTCSRVVLALAKPIKRMLQLTFYQGSIGEDTQVLHLRDVTHETEVDRIKGEFLSMAAHELRTPLASIFGFSELLLNREMSPAKQKDLLGRIYRHSRMVTEIVNELLDLARIEARRGADFQLEATHLGQLVCEVVQDFQQPENRAAPDVSGEDDALWVTVDRGKMRQAVLNVLSNAYKYSPQGGSVRVELVSRMQADVRQHGTRITDQGLGLSAEQLAHMGERFYRADKSGNIPGTGLGVSLVKEIIELMGGELEIESHEGEGTQVCLWLPARAVETVEAVMPG